MEADFRRVHTHLPPDRDLSEPTSLLAEARGILRDRFLAADVGITGANFLVAETGSSIIVTNEGNGDLTQILPRIHIVIASIEKIVPTLDDASTILRLLARSATGQDMSVYTTVSTGPRRPEDPDGPDEYHVVILDNGRTAMLGTEYQEMLRCIRCGACMNHCPVYHAVGGHAYGATYPGPMGQVLDPAIFGLEKTHELPNASTFCGRCESVCPMMIPLPGLMRHWRDKEFERGLSPATQRYGIRFWAFFARRPALYRFATRIAMRALGNLGRGAGRFAVPAACRRLDQAPRHAGAGRPHLHGPLSAPAEAARERSRRRPRQGAARARRHRRRRGAGVAPSRRGSKLRTEHHSGARAARPRRAQSRSSPNGGASLRHGRAVASPDDVPAAVARYLRGHNLPLQVRTGRARRSRRCRGSASRISSG